MYLTRLFVLGWLVGLAEMGYPRQHFFTSPVACVIMFLARSVAHVRRRYFGRRGRGGGEVRIVEDTVGVDDFFAELEMIPWLRRSLK